MDVEAVLTLIGAAIGAILAGGAGGAVIVRRHRQGAEVAQAAGWTPEDTGRYPAAGYAPPPGPPIAATPEIDPQVVAVIVEQVAKALMAPLHAEITRLQTLVEKEREAREKLWRTINENQTRLAVLEAEDRRRHRSPIRKETP